MFGFREPTVGQLPRTRREHTMVEEKRKTSVRPARRIQGINGFCLSVLGIRLWRLFTFYRSFLLGRSSVFPVKPLDGCREIKFSISKSFMKVTIKKWKRTRCPPVSKHPSNLSLKVLFLVQHQRVKERKSRFFSTSTKSIFSSHLIS